MSNPDLVKTGIAGLDPILSDGIPRGNVILVEALQIDAPRTKDMVNLLETTGAEGNTLILTSGNNPNVWMSARNLEGVQVRPFGEESTYDVLWADTVIIEASALEQIKETANA